MLKLKKLFLISFLLIFLLSCGSKKEDKESKTLNIYTWTYFIPKEVIEGFEKETGIKVQVDFYDTNEQMYAKLKSGARGYDIVSPSTDILSIMREEGMLEKLDKEKLKTVYENLRMDEIDKFSESYDPHFQYSLPYTFSATGIAVNKKYIKDYPRSFEIFSMEQYKGRMTMLDDMRETLGATLQFLGYSAESSNDQELEAAKNKLLEWKKNIAKFDSATFGKNFASGEFYISHGYAENFFEELSDSEIENTDYFIPKGAMMYIDSMAILQNSPNKENAYKFLEYLYRPENFKKVYEIFRAPSVIKGIEENSSIKPYVTFEDVVTNATLPKALSNETLEKQQKIWESIKLQ